jgi:hypothetical protein
MEINKEWIAEQRAVCEAATPGPWEVLKFGRYEDHDECQIDLPDDDIELAKYENAEFIAAARTALPAALDALEASMQREAEKDATIARLTSERDAAVKDLTTAMTDLYIEGRIDETDICWACKFAKKDKEEHPCNSCINYEMTEFTHRGVCEDE